MSASHTSRVFLYVLAGFADTRPTVRRTPARESGDCPLPRVAGRPCHPSMSQTPRRRHHRLYNSRDPPRPVLVRRFGGLLQQPPVLRCRPRGRKTRDLPPLLHRAICGTLCRCFHNCLPHHVVDTLRLAKLLPQASHFALQLRDARLQRHPSCLGARRSRIHKVSMVFEELVSRVRKECASGRLDMGSALAVSEGCKLRHVLVLEGEAATLRALP